MQLINGKRWAEYKEGLHQSSFWVLRQNACAATTDVPSTVDSKLISSEFSVPSFSYLYISCGPNGVSTKQRRTTSAQTTLALVSLNRLSIPQAEESWLSSVSLEVWLSSRVWSSWTPSKMFCRRLSAIGKTLWRGNNRSRLIEQAYRISLWSKASAMLNWTLFFFFVFVDGRGAVLLLH